MPETGSKPIPEGWELTGDTTANGTPYVTNGKERRILANGGLLKCDGNPGNSGGGRIAEKVRLDATQGLQKEVSRIAGLLTTMVDRAGKELGESGSLDKGLATMREIGRIANTLTSIGPGTKVTNVVEKGEYHDRAAAAFDQWQEEGSGTRLRFLELLKEALND